jgi:hypothetical protein
MIIINIVYFYQNNMTLYDFVISAAAAGIAEISTLPICTIKTNYQNTDSKSIIDTIKTIHRNGGIRSFYTASYPAIGSQIVSTSTKYTLYRHLNTKYNKDKKFILSCIVGCTSGLTSSLITHPLDTVRVHLQMKTPFIPEFRQYGFKLLYRGYTKTLGKVVTSSLLFFPLYDYFYKLTDNTITASGLTALIATTIMQPFDYLKTRQIYGLSLYNNTNPLIYFKGLTLSLFRIVPHFTIIMSIIHFGSIFKS